MNYEKQIRAFEDIISKDPLKLTRSAQVLWYRLVNYPRFPVEVKSAVLIRLMGATDKTFFTAQKELIDQGFITYEAGTKGKPSKYKIKRLY